MEEYEISKDTLLLFSIDKKITKVYEKNNSFEVNLNSSKILDNSCKYFGSSLTGRQEGSKNLIYTSIKVPIIVEETNNIIFFPTSSPRNNICHWISYNNLVKYEKINNYSTRLYFISGFCFDIDISYSIIDNQITRCIKLEKILMNRKTML